MKITGDGYEITQYINDTTLNPTEDEQTEKATAETPSPEEDVIVNLSAEAKDVQKAKEVIESEPDIREEKVSAIQEEVEQGTYEIDYDQTAEQMVGQFIDQMG